MRRHTTPDQRREFYAAHQRGETYQKIADRYKVSKECVRNWCRRQRDGGSCESVYHKKAPGMLNGFDDLVGFYILNLKLAHPRWGPSRIRHGLEKEPKLQGKKLPSPATIGRYLHQWPCFRRQPTKKVEDKRPDPPTEVHQRWQLDFKVNIALQDGTAVDLHTVRDPVGEACVGAVVHVTQQVTIRTKRVSMEDARSTLRRCFDFWTTLPDEVQTDGEPTLVARKKDAFPSIFTMWLKGLDITHLVTRSGKPTDNAEVERCHRTVNEYAIVGNEKHPVIELQPILDEAVLELAFDLPSRAEGCAGRTPIEAHPELMEPRRSFRAEHELALFDLKRVDAFLSTFTWSRKVGKTGQICIGGHHNYYSVGRACAGQEVWVRFDPTDRHFVFYLPSSELDDLDELQEVGRRPARHLEVEDLTGLAAWPAGLVPQQLPLPLCFAEG
jgi:transposase InsO family protein